MENKNKQRRVLTVVLLRVAWVSVLLFLVVRAVQTIRAWLLVSGLLLPPLPHRHSDVGSLRTSTRSDAPTASTGME